MNPFSAEEQTHINYIKNTILEEFPDATLRAGKKVMGSYEYNCVFVKEKEIFLSNEFILLLVSLTQDYLYAQKLFKYIILIGV